MHALRHCARSTQKGGARVGNGNTVTLLAERQAFSRHNDTHKLQLPISQLRLVHGNPLQITGQAAFVVASKRDFTRHLVASREEVPEGLLGQTVHLGHLSEEAEFRIHGQTGQTQAQHAIKLESHEGLLGHLARQNHTKLGAILARSCHGTRSEANGFPHKLASHLAGAEGNVHLVPARGVLLHRVSIVIQVDCRSGHVAVKLPVTGASW
mmetsp:Transcript_73621/g.117103  ORF Transcript_73621/g.117103 Transcript_73621/m.117103 type:complete len:210 (-) Transcript_73621:338-967(-)